jgi:hypothetical protein
LANRDTPCSSEKQYKTQLKKWSLDTKYIKASEYLFMIKTMRERAAQNPPKETQFVLRGRVVDPKDIARFEKRAQKRGSLKKGDPIECDGKALVFSCTCFYGPVANSLCPEPVEDLVYGTPAPEEASYHAAAYAEAYESYQCTAHQTLCLSPPSREETFPDFFFFVPDDSTGDYSYAY